MPRAYDASRYSSFKGLAVSVWLRYDGDTPTHERLIMTNTTNLPADTHVTQGQFYSITEANGESFFVEACYLSDVFDNEPDTFATLETGTFAAVNDQDPEGNGIESVFATLTEAEAYLIERFEDAE